MISTSDIINLTRQDMHARLRALEAVAISEPLTCTFSVAELEHQHDPRNHPTNKKVDAWLKGTDADKRPAIYVIDAITPQLAGAMGEAFDKLSPGAFSRPRRNATRKDSTVLYVGSSVTGIRSRLKQHLRSAYNGTYALHLNRWISSISADHKIDAAITVTVWTVVDPGNLGLTQNLEDGLWSYYEPLFGKRGGK